MGIICKVTRCTVIYLRLVENRKFLEFSLRWRRIALLKENGAPIPELTNTPSSPLIALSAPQPHRLLSCSVQYPPSPAPHGGQSPFKNCRHFLDQHCPCGPGYTE